MKPQDPHAPADHNEEIAALIATLHATGERLEMLTGGEVDGVTNLAGGTFLLQRAQDRLRHSDESRQAAILNALPAHVAMLDGQGVVVAVNEAWRRFARTNALHSPGHAVGMNYLSICEAAADANAAGALEAAAGIRSVLAGHSPDFSLEYPCHSPGEQRWFLMTVTPLSPNRGGGAAVMHVDISERKRSEENIVRLNRIYAVLSGINSAIVRIGDRQALFEETCRIAKAEGGFSLAWIIALEADGKARVACTTNPDTIWIDSLLAEYNADPVGTAGLIPLALRTGQVFVANDVAKDDRIPDRANLTAKGNFAVALFPLMVEKRVVGLLSLRSQELGVFNAGELGLLGELTANLSLALDRFEKAAQIDLFAVARAQDEALLRRFSSAMNVSEDAIYLVDRSSMAFSYVNDAACRMQGRTRNELLALGFAGSIAPPLAQLERTYDAVIASGEPAEPLEVQRPGADGKKAWVEIRRHAQRSGDDWTIVTLVRDITERKASEARITYLNRVYAVLSGINTLIVRVRDREELFKEACRIAVKAGGFRSAWISLVDASQTKVVLAASSGASPNLLAVVEKRFSMGGDLPLGGSLTACAIREKKLKVSNDSLSDPGVWVPHNGAYVGTRSIVILPLVVGEVAVGALALYAGETDFFHDEELTLLTELAGDVAFAIDHLAKQERLSYLAYYDDLTGLANRSLFLERLSQYVHSAKTGAHKLAVFVVDLERFRNINDTLGRPAGDALLGKVAEWLRMNVGDANLLARVGADEFAVILPEINAGGNVASLVEKTLNAFLEHPFHLGDSIFRIAAKVGTAVYPDDGAVAETLLKNAEAALKKAKSSGTRHVFYEQKMTASNAGKLTLENQLRRALDQEEFVLHYQPKINLKSRKVVGAEALIRWADPLTGLVPPGRFIPVLEETGMIHDVGRWALQKAVADYLRWHAAGLPAVRIAVNVSPIQLRDPHFIAEIKEALAMDANAPAGLEIEITESVIMEDVRNSIASLQAIRAMDVTIAIDDFGTGFSSLSYLARLPVDTLKIDRSFVTDMTTSPNGLSLVSTIINLAHALKLKVVAEGVEAEEQSRLLLLLGCDEMQGFLFSKPVPSQEFEKRFLAAAQN